MRDPETRSFVPQDQLFCLGRPVVVDEVQEPLIYTLSCHSLSCQESTSAERRNRNTRNDAHECTGLSVLLQPIEERQGERSRRLSAVNAVKELALFSFGESVGDIDDMVDVRRIKVEQSIMLGLPLGSIFRLVRIPPCDPWLRQWLVRPSRRLTG